MNDTHHSDPADYNVNWDIYGPQFFLPTQCLLETSVQIPRRTSNDIAVVKGVGDTADIEDRVLTYFRKLVEV